MNSFKNIVTKFAGQLLSILLRFITRTVFIHALSAEYLGVNGLFTSILTVLNLSELGIGTAIVYAMYKPIAEDDTEKIKSLMYLYRKSYLIIGWIFLALGLMLLPFLKIIIKGGTDLVNIEFIYILYIFNSVSTYWFFAYKSAILDANQKTYLVSVIKYISNIIVTVVRLLVLMILRNKPEISFYIFTIVGIAGNIGTNLIIKSKVDNIYPYLKDENVQKLSREEKKPIYKNIFGLSISKISGIMLTATDNIIISALIGLTTVGLYSNYIMIRTSVKSILGSIFSSITASLGNFCATESRERQESLFESLHFLYFWIYGFCAICFLILFNPFVGGVWLNEDFMLSNTVVLLISVNFLLDGLAGAVIKFRDVNGLYWQTRYRYLFSALFNAVFSFILAGPLQLGIEGVLIGTTCSIISMISLDPIIVYKNIFHKSSAKYYLSYFKYLGVIILTAIIVILVSLPFSELSIHNFIFKLMVCLIIPNGLWLLMFYKNKHFIYLRNTILGLFQHLIIKFKYERGK